MGGIAPRVGLKPQVFFEQPMLLLLSRASQSDRLCNHGGYDRQETKIFFEGHPFFEQTVRAESPYDFVFQLDGDADEGNILFA